MKKEELERFQQLNGFLISMGAYCSQHGFSILTSYDYEVTEHLTIYLNLELKSPANPQNVVIYYQPNSMMPLKYDKDQLKLIITDQFKRIFENQLSYISIY